LPGGDRSSKEALIAEDDIGKIEVRCSVTKPVYVGKSRPMNAPRPSVELVSALMIVQLRILDFYMVHFGGGTIGLLDQAPNGNARLRPRLNVRRITANELGLGRHSTTFHLWPK
jgi:hypothetical protein